MSCARAPGMTGPTRLQAERRCPIPPPARAARALSTASLVAGAGVALHVVVVSGVGLRVIWVRRPAGSAFAWLLLVVLLPLVGLVLYLLFGERPIGRKRLRRAHAFYADFAALAAPLWAPTSRARGTAARCARPGEPGAAGQPACRCWSARRWRCTPAPRPSCGRSSPTSTRRARAWTWRSTSGMPGGLADEVATALERAARRGVRCRMLLDALGSKAFLRSELAGAPARGGRPPRGRTADRSDRPDVPARRPATASQDRRRRRARRLHRQHEPGRPALLQAGRRRRRVGRRDGAHRRARRWLRCARCCCSTGTCRPATRSWRRARRIRRAARGGWRGAGAGRAVGPGRRELGQPAHPRRCRRRRPPAHRADDALLRARPGAARWRCRTRRCGASRSRSSCRPSTTRSSSPMPAAPSSTTCWRPARTILQFEGGLLHTKSVTVDDELRAVRHRQPRHAQPAPELRADAGRLRPWLQCRAARVAAGLRAQCAASGRCRMARASGARTLLEGAASLVAPML